MHEHKENQQRPTAEELPLSQRPMEDLPGHWVLARLGKRVLRPGGAELTNAMLKGAGLQGADVVELAPGLGRTAAEILTYTPTSYVGVDQDPKAALLVGRVVGQSGRVVTAEAAQTGLPEDSADVVVGEAMLTMQSERGKKAIIDEALRVLRPDGRYAIHELGLAPDSLAEEIKTNIRKDLARAIKVNARPLTIAEWSELLEEAGLVVEKVETAPMALLELRRNLSDEGLGGTLRIVGNVLRNPAARKRVLQMRRTFRKYREHLIAVSIIARVGTSDTTR